MNYKEQFESLDLKEINRFLKDSQTENLNLDFKTIEIAGLSRNDRKNYAKCVSGFANSSGGIIVWGIDARKDSSGIDCASKKTPIIDLALFVSTINKLTGDSTDPIVEGIIHKQIEEGKNKGYVITLIPESIFGPHMAKLGEDRYYKRSGDSFYKMEHYDIEDMFGRRMKPHLTLTTKLRNQGQRTSIIIGLQNTGRGTAKAPYIAFDSPEPFILSPYGYDGNGNEGLPRLSPGSDELKHRYGANSDFVIHPGTSIDVASLYLGHASTKRKNPPPSVEINYEVAAEGLRLTRSKVNVDLTHVIVESA